MLKKIIFYTVMTITTILMQEINTAECQSCLSLQNQLIIALQEQKTLMTNNLEFATANERLCKENEKLIKEFENLMKVNNTLTNIVDTLLRFHNPQICANGILCLLNQDTSKCKGFYFSEGVYKVTFQSNKSVSNWNRS